MKKKRILYSELAAPVPAPAPAVPVPAAVPAPAALPAEAPAAASPSPARASAVAAAAALRSAAAAPVRPPAAAPARPVTARPAAPAGPRVLRDQVRARSGRVEVLLFRVASEQFAVELGAVEEAIDIPPVHHVPEMPPAMLGVITVRGTLTSVYSPGPALGLALHDGTSALIFRRGRARVAIVVDEVDDVATLDLALLRDAPTADTGDGIVLGVVRQRDMLLALVDADALIAACQAAPLLETA